MTKTSYDRVNIIEGYHKSSFSGYFFSCLNVRLVCGWSNGGYSNDPTSPKYGTHDWIAQHALDWLPTQEKQYLLNNLPNYLYGTELPDNGGAPDCGCHYCSSHSSGLETQTT